MASSKEASPLGGGGGGGCCNREVARGKLTFVPFCSCIDFFTWLAKARHALQNSSSYV